MIRQWAMIVVSIAAQQKVQRYGAGGKICTLFNSEGSNALERKVLHLYLYAGLG